jgi:hypothetical protein
LLPITGQAEVVIQWLVSPTHDSADSRTPNLDSCGRFHKTRPQALHANLPRLLWLWVFNHRSPLHHCLLASTFQCLM